MSEETAGGGASKLDTLSKEELVKLVKKYIVLHKQLKTKNEGIFHPETIIFHMIHSIFDSVYTLYIDIIETKCLIKVLIQLNVH